MAVCMQGVYMGQNDVPKFKPGWMASAAGAVLEFEVNTVLGSNTSATPADHGHGHGHLATAATASLLLTYTVSYDGWGKAQVRSAGLVEVGWLCRWG